ncbi:MAG: ArsR/SmtB family transcription factor [Aestuariibacter sp.]
MVTYNNHLSDRVWKAISDGKRRSILDALSGQPMSTGQLVEMFPTIGRTAVLKHIGILHDADLIKVKREGRTRWNYINTKPLESVCSGWLLRHTQGVTSSIQSLKQLAEKE